MEYDLNKPWLTLDPWQKGLINSEGDVVVISGRQCGKTTATSILAAKTALKNPNEHIVIGAYVIEQAEIIFRKIHEYVLEKAPNMIKGRVTLNVMQLTNNSVIRCRPIGDTGAGMRGYSATMLIIDEAAFVPNRAWEAIEPVISVTKGRAILLSTPQGKRGFFYKASVNKEYLRFQVSARDCPRHTKKFLDRKEAEMSPIAFATEYLGEFIDDYNRKFSEEWIKLVCTIDKKKLPPISKRNQTLGIDVGGEGPDDTTFEGFDANNQKNIFQTLNIFSPTISGPKIERQIETLKDKYNYDRRSIGFDSGGLGSGTFAYMMENSKLKRCIVALDNSQRPTEHQKDGKKTKLLKEYMYDLIEEMGWRGELKCFDEGSVKQSFESIQIEFRDGGKKRYWGTYAHIVEGISRGVYVAKTKGLKIYLR